MVEGQNPADCKVSSIDAIRADAEIWRDRATSESSIDRKAEETLALIAEIDRLRLVEAEYEAVIQQQQAEVRRDG